MDTLARHNSGSSIKEQWRSVASQPKYWIVLIIAIIICAVESPYLAKFLLYKESIQGAELWDPITCCYPPIDFNSIIFYLTMSFIAIGAMTSIITPRGLLHSLYGFALVNAFRVIVLYFINLEPPADIIPLYDPLLEKTFYQDVLITKDLFFSGHTSNIVIFGFLTQVPRMRYVIFAATFAVGTMLVLQHVHYTIDVVAAPFFAYLAYVITDKVLGNFGRQSAV